MKNLAIIPARSGSKGIKDKNIRELFKKPLMAYSIEAAIQSGLFDEIMVSTDSEEYAVIARKYGAAVPFMRSEGTASDSASSDAVIEEVLREYEKIHKEFDSFCLLQPTSPLRTADDIVRAYELFEEKKPLAVVSVCEPEHTPLWCGQLPDSGEFVDFINSDSLKRRQDSEKYYRLNGAVYIVDCARYLSGERDYYKNGSYAYIMQRENSVDIDTEIDFIIAEALMKSHFTSEGDEKI